MRDGVVLVVHGGAGNPPRGAEGELGLRHGLRSALEEGRAVLRDGGSALDAVERVVRRLESHPLFNAGRGSVLCAGGWVEMDAAVMEGTEHRAGAVCAVRRLAHPVSAARLVMERSRHVLLAGRAAEDFALAHGAEEADSESLVTEERQRQLERARRADRVPLDHDDGRDGDADAAPDGERDEDDAEHGTVGAVARDRHGHLAAATSTGGLVDKLPGRVGDSPLIGAGTWADDATCAVSATGHGESLILAAAAHEVDARLRLAGASLAEAAERALEGARRLGGGGGLVALDRSGRFATPFTTRALYRGWIALEGEPVVRIFADE